MTAAPTANMVKPVGPVDGSLRAYLTDGNPPGGGPSWRTGMSLTDCSKQAGPLVAVYTSRRATLRLALRC